MEPDPVGWCVSPREAEVTAEDAQIKLKSLASPAAAKLAIRFFKTGPGQYGEGDTFIGIKVPTLRVVSREFRALCHVGCCAKFGLRVLCRTGGWLCGREVTCERQ